MQKLFSPQLLLPTRVSLTHVAVPVHLQVREVILRDRSTLEHRVLRLALVQNSVPRNLWLHHWIRHSWTIKAPANRVRPLRARRGGPRANPHQSLLHLIRNSSCAAGSAVERCGSVPREHAYRPRRCAAAGQRLGTPAAGGACDARIEHNENLASPQGSTRTLGFNTTAKVVSRPAGRQLSLGDWCAKAGKQLH